MFSIRPTRCKLKTALWDFIFTMSQFDKLSREEKKIRDSIILDRLKKELEFFDVPFGAIQRVEQIRDELEPYLKSENKIEVAIAVDCFHKITEFLFILKLLKNGK